jgi:hypothetical protein
VRPALLHGSLTLQRSISPSILRYVPIDVVSLGCEGTAAPTTPQSRKCGNREQIVLLTSERQPAEVPPGKRSPRQNVTVSRDSESANPSAFLRKAKMVLEAFASSTLIRSWVSPAREDLAGYDHIEPNTAPCSTREGSHHKIVVTCKSHSATRA